jgi:hypothetical protein
MGRIETEIAHCRKIRFKKKQINGFAIGPVVFAPHATELSE